MDVYDRAGMPISVQEFDRLLGQAGYKRVAQTTVGPYWISTVWLGLNHNFTGAGPPLIFETMVFPATAGALLEFDCRRYSTEDEARVGHDDFVTLVRATTVMDDEAAVRDDEACGETADHRDR